MKLLFVLAALLVTAHALSDQELHEQFQEVENVKFDDDFMSALQVEQLPAAINTGVLSTYLPEAGPYDNPATVTTPVPIINSSPACTVRGQTIFEIRKMRADAKQIGMSIMYEIQTMEKRKAYIEQMTQYLNDRIRELNKVKRDLAAEQKWIELSNSRIAELAQREKLIKLQDVMQCIRDERDREKNEGQTKAQTVAAMEAQAAAIEANINKIRSQMNSPLDGFGAPTKTAASGSSEASAAASSSEDSVSFF